MEDLFDNDDKVVRCFCCSNWVRESATATILTGERGDPELWCIGCIRDVDEYTLDLKQPEQTDSTYDFEEGDSE